MSKVGIAIDGPAGAGKTTIVKLVAKELKINYVDTGAFYRTVAYAINKKGLTSAEVIKMSDEEVKKLLDEMIILPDYRDGMQINTLNGSELDDNDLRTGDMSKEASLVSTHKLVRQKVTSISKEVAKKFEVAMEGRDIGTVIMPDAKLKVYLDAQVEERAKRRILQLQEKGLEAPSFEEMVKDIEDRDYQDSHRAESPLMVADGAMVLDSTNYTIPEVVKIIVDKYNEE